MKIWSECHPKMQPAEAQGIYLLSAALQHSRTTDLTQHIESFTPHPVRTKPTSSSRPNLQERDSEIASVTQRFMVSVHDWLPKSWSTSMGLWSGWRTSRTSQVCQQQHTNQVSTLLVSPHPHDYLPVLFSHSFRTPNKREHPFKKQTNKQTNSTNFASKHTMV